MDKHGLEHMVKRDTENYNRMSAVYTGTFAHIEISAYGRPPAFSKHTVTICAVILWVFFLMQRVV